MSHMLVVNCIDSKYQVLLNGKIYFRKLSILQGLSAFLVFFVFFKGIRYTLAWFKAGVCVGT